MMSAVSIKLKIAQTLRSDWVLTAQDGSHYNHQKRVQKREISLSDGDRALLNVKVHFTRTQHDWNSNVDHRTYRTSRPVPHHR